MPEIWRTAAKIYWCPNCNVPLIAPRCGLCSEQATKAHGSPPKDFRPALDYDFKILREVVEREFGAKACNIIIPSDVVLFNKIPYVDQANEVIVDGWVMGNLYYSPDKSIWRFRPSYEGAARLVLENAAPYVEVLKDRIRLWDELAKSEFRGDAIPPSGKYVILVNSKFSTIGVAVSLDNGRLKVVKVWEPHRPHVRDKKSDWGIAIRANEPHMEVEEKRAITLITKITEGRKVFVSYSGGKDSLVTLLLTLRALGDVPLLFNDTGIEAPATIEHVWEVANRFGLELIYASAGDIFWKALPTYGPPARDYRWCCKVCKLVPIAKAVREKFQGEVYTILGQRKYESFARLRASVIERSRWIPNLLGVSPIRDWSALHVWLYLMKEKVRFNPLYKEGFDRIGCWLCPACELAEFERVKELYPDLWSKWEESALEWCKEKGLPQEWFKLGLWRWRKLPGDAKKLAIRMKVNVNYIEQKLTGLKEVDVSLIVRPCDNLYEAQGSISGPLDLNRVSMMLKCVGGRVSINEKLGLAVLRTDEGIASLNRDGSFSIRAEDDHSLRRVVEVFVKSLLRAKYCNSCGSCRNWCPTNSITMVNEGVRVLDTCLGCRSCIHACPIATYMYKFLVHVVDEEYDQG
ncbi:MAG: phosphoadenosine phosphosulfate reductase family protein [Candidatus Nezhaarchaeota archaeon]|nr:phosphoadenosine phosphosulfate reductase family protein [Candidatus Nezhaarchaeota archaeon]